jgi:dsDNA-specific endonuclease/ATPase MutS2
LPVKLSAQLPNIKKECYLIIATHLGHEISKRIPARARIDGIQAKGLSAGNELIVDHNPLLGTLAHSTPELIIERMAKINQSPYFAFLHGEVSSKNSNIPSI